MDDTSVKKSRKRTSMSLHMKMKILNQLDDGNSPAILARKYGISESTVRTIRKMGDSIRNNVTSGTLEVSKCASYARNPLMANMERELIVWIQFNSEKGTPVNSSQIRQKAVTIFKSLKQQVPLAVDYEFTGSKGWFDKFRKIYSLRNIKVKDVNNKTGYVMDLGVIAKINDANSSLDSDSSSSSNNNSVVKSDVPQPEVIPIARTSPIVNKSDSESDSSSDSTTDSEESVAFNAGNIGRALQLAEKLSTTFADMDPDIHRALKFGKELRKCCRTYREIYGKLRKAESILMSNNPQNSSSSSD